MPDLMHFINPCREILLPRKISVLHRCIILWKNRNICVEGVGINQMYRNLLQVGKVEQTSPGAWLEKILITCEGCSDRNKGSLGYTGLSELLLENG